MDCAQGVKCDRSHTAQLDRLPAGVYAVDSGKGLQLTEGQAMKLIDYTPERWAKMDALEASLDHSKMTWAEARQVQNERDARETEYTDCAEAEDWTGARLAGRRIGVLNARLWEYLNAGGI